MSEDDGVPIAVERGWNQYTPLDDDVMALLGYPSGAWRFQHRCERAGRGVIVCAPLLQTAIGGHTITIGGDGEPTVSPSILCNDCGTHGFIRAGRWVPS